MPDPARSERPIALLLLSSDPTFSQTVWSALVKTLGDEDARRLYLPPKQTAQGTRLLQALHSGQPSCDLVLVDVRARDAIGDLEQDHYQRFGATPALALVPDDPEIVRFEEETEQYYLQPEWGTYFAGWEVYRDVLVFPEEGGALHSLIAEAIGVTPRDPSASVGLPPAAESPSSGAQHAQAASAPLREPGSGPTTRVVPPPALTERPLATPMTTLLPPQDDQEEEEDAVVPPPAEPQAMPFLAGGMLAVWSPFDGVGRTTASLELAAALAAAGCETLLGEFRRPLGFLATKVDLDDYGLAHSFLALAQVLSAQSAEGGGPLRVRRDDVRAHLLVRLPLDARRGEEGPALEFFHAGFSARQEDYYDLAILNERRSVQGFLEQLLAMLKGAFLFQVFAVGSSPLDPLHFLPLQKCDRMVVCVPADAPRLAVASVALQMVQRLTEKAATTIDVVLTQWDRAMPAEKPAPLRDLLATGQVADERHQRKILQALHLERELEAFLASCGLASRLTALLPDERPLTWKLYREGRLAPAVTQRALAQDPYVLAIKGQLLPNYVLVPDGAAATGPSRGKSFLFKR